MNRDVEITVLVLILALIFFYTKKNPILDVDNTSEIFTKYGKVSGIKLQLETGKSAYGYFGIPYAKPPVADLRFKPPLDIEAWNEVRNVSRKSKSCIQSVENVPSHLNWFVDLENEVSEDCLYLNIWTPSPTTGGAAVMVWIHGGGYEAGSGNQKKYDGSVLASEEKVIVVAINYRVGVFGFLYSDKVEEAPGNVGLMDQQLALRWVKNNIASFGGDPQRITIFGESSGSSSVEFHLLLSSSRDLFQRAILQSGSDLAGWRHLDKSEARDYTQQLSQILGCSDKKLVDFECLRKVESNKLIETVSKIKSNAEIIFKPLVDGVFIQHTKQELLRRGMLEHSIDILLGNTKEDGYFMLLAYGDFDFGENVAVSDELFIALITYQIDTDIELLVDLVKSVYTDWNDTSNLETMRQKMIDFKTDYLYTCGMNWLAEHAVENKNKVFRYQFNHRPSNTVMPSWSGSVHGDEIDFVFGKPLIVGGTFTEEEIQLSKNVMELFAGFAKNGNPKEWPVFDLENKNYLEIGVNMKIETKLREKECHFWKNIYPKLKDQFAKIL